MVQSIKEAEELAASIVRQASEQAKELLKNSEADALMQKNRILEDARLENKKKAESAEQKTKESCDRQRTDSEKELEAFAKSALQKKDRAVALLMERIVGSLGNS